MFHCRALFILSIGWELYVRTGPVGDEGWVIWYSWFVFCKNLSDIYIFQVNSECRFWIEKIISKSQSSHWPQLLIYDLKNIFLVIRLCFLYSDIWRSILARCMAGALIVKVIISWCLWLNAGQLHLTACMRWI